MKLVQHYNDLTEVNNLRTYSRGSAGEVLDSLTSLQNLEKTIKTYIAFTDVKPTNYPATAELMDKCGWKIATKTLDWHDWHGGDCELRLYYKLFPENVSDLKNKQDRGPCTYSCHQSLSGSCSMGLVNGLDKKKWLISKNNPHKYLTLIRLDRKRTKEEVAEMRYYRYKLVFKSDVARYFANGWLPEEWPGKVAEKSWWETPEAPKMNGFVYKAE